MRKKHFLLLTTVCIIGMLTGCAMKTSQQSAGGTGGAAGSAAVSANSGTADAQQGSDSSADGAGINAAAAADSGSSDGSGLDSGSTGGPSADDTASGNAGASDAVTPKGWDGTYSSESGETLTISQTDETAFSFAFAVSGISGNAQAEGDEAYFYGDDDNVVHFFFQGDAIEVRIEDGAGNETPDSPLAGLFYRG